MLQRGGGRGEEREEAKQRSELKEKKERTIEIQKIKRDIFGLLTCKLRIDVGFRKREGKGQENGKGTI